MSGQAFLSKVYDSEEQAEEYPKYFDFKVREMSVPVAKYLGLLLFLGIVMFLITAFSEQGYFRIYRLMSECVILTAVILFVMLGININRVAKTVIIEKDCFYVNGDRFPIDDTTKVKIAPLLPVAGKADNIYLRVKSKSGTKKYWVGVLADPDSSITRDNIKTELIRLSSSLLE